jgi:cytochrome c
MRPGPKWILVLGLSAALAALFGFAAAYRDTHRLVRQANARTGGASDRGAAAIARFGCGACHEILGIRDARGLVGPPLQHMAKRAYIAGTIPNTPINMILWLRWPQGLMPKSAMPNMGISLSDSRDMAAYLFTLQ